MKSAAARRAQTSGAGQIVRAAFGGLPSGAGFGAWVGSIAVRMNPSLHGPRQATAFVLLCVAVYAFALALVGLFAAIIARPMERARRVGDDEGFLPDFIAPLAGAIVFALVHGVIRRFAPSGDEDNIVHIAVALGLCLIAAILVRVLLARVVHVGAAFWGAIGVAAIATPVFVWITLRGAGALRFGAPDDAPASLAPVADKPHVVVVALDGADWEQLTPLLDAGRLPNFARLCKGAFIAPLATVDGACSPSVWTSIATGELEVEHGVIDTSEIVLPILDGGVQRARLSRLGEPLLPRNVGLVPSLEWAVHAGIASDLPISAMQRRRKAFWNVLADRGVRVGIVAWPATWPAEKVEGYLIADDHPLLQKFAANQLGSGDNAKTARTAFPAELTTELVPMVEADGPLGVLGDVALEELLAHPVLAAIGENERRLLRADESLRGRFELLVRGDRFATRAAVHVWTQKTIYLLAVRLRSIGGVSRALPAFPGVVERSYEFVDQLLGELIDASPADTTFVVVSERGHDDAGESEDEAAPAPGVLVIRGPHVVAQPAAELDPSAFDVAPTLLALFGLPPQKDWPGRPLHEVFAPESAAGRASEPIESYGAYRPSWPELAEITELQSQREALRWLRELDALGP